MQSQVDQARGLAEHGHDPSVDGELGAVVPQDRPHLPPVGRGAGERHVQVDNERVAPPRIGRRALHSRVWQRAEVAPEPGPLQRRVGGGHLRRVHQQVGVRVRPGVVLVVQPAGGARPLQHQALDAGGREGLHDLHGHGVHRHRPHRGRPLGRIHGYLS